MRVKFTKLRVVQDEHVGTARETRFEAGRVYDLPEPSALHWIDRGVAEAVPAEMRSKAHPTAKPRSSRRPKVKA